MGRTPTGNLVLDIDGTLIDSLPEGYGHTTHRTPDYVSKWGDLIYFVRNLSVFRNSEATHCPSSLNDEDPWRQDKKSGTGLPALFLVI